MSNEEYQSKSKNKLSKKLTRYLQRPIQTEPNDEEPITQEPSLQNSPRFRISPKKTHQRTKTLTSSTNQKIIKLESDTEKNKFIL